MATDHIEQEFKENGITEVGNGELESEYNSLINEMNANPKIANIARFVKTLYNSFKSVSSNDKKLRKMYKDLKKALDQKTKQAKTYQDEKSDEQRNYENLKLKYEEALKSSQAAREELKQKETEKNQFTISDKKEEPEIDEGLLQELRLANEKLTSELSETKNK